MMPELVQNGRSHRGERHRQNSSRGGFSEHKVASDLVVHSQDLCIFPTQGGQLRPGQVLSGVDICPNRQFDIHPWVFWGKMVSPGDKILSPCVKEVMQGHA